jgi:hypothetical protein
MFCSPQLLSGTQLKQPLFSPAALWGRWFTNNTTHFLLLPDSLSQTAHLYESTCTLSDGNGRNSELKIALVSPHKKSALYTFLLVAEPPLVYLARKWTQERGDV